jgi:hypothetical protein
MSRTVLGLVLGGALVLAAAGCARQSPSETTPMEAENLEAGIPDTGNTDAQSQESKERPIVTVSRSPT